jgi:hypothetical protein
MQRVEDEVLTLVGPGMPGNDVRATGDHHLVDIAADPLMERLAVLSPSAPCEKRRRR